MLHGLVVDAVGVLVGGFRAWGLVPFYVANILCRMCVLLLLSLCSTPLDGFVVDVFYLSWLFWWGVAVP